jgi:hypothetical protein
VLEKASMAFAHLEEVSSLVRRCVTLEEALLDLRRQVNLMAERQTATPHVPTPAPVTAPIQQQAPERHLVTPQSVAPEVSTRKGFFQSLFGRS